MIVSALAEHPLPGQDVSEVTPVRQLALRHQRHSHGLDPDQQRRDAATGEQGECCAVAGTRGREFNKCEDQTSRGDQRGVNGEVYLGLAPERAT
jgi:hypothetical protein